MLCVLALVVIVDFLYWVLHLYMRSIIVVNTFIYWYS